MIQWRAQQSPPMLRCQFCWRVGTPLYRCGSCFFIYCQGCVPELQHGCYVAGYPCISQHSLIVTIKITDGTRGVQPGSTNVPMTIEGYYLSRMARNIVEQDYVSAETEIDEDGIGYISRPAWEFCVMRCSNTYIDKHEVVIEIMTSTSPGSGAENQGEPSRSSGRATDTNTQGGTQLDPTSVQDAVLSLLPRNVIHRLDHREGWYSQPRRGDYFRQTIRKIPGVSKLPWYFLAPSNRSRMPAVYDGLDRGTVFGPVHDYESSFQSFGFVSILVPPPWSMIPEEDQDMIPDLVWINVSKMRRVTLDHRLGPHTRVTWAERVEDEVVESWHREGWIDRYIALPPVYVINS